ncbi:hypothetical protein JCM14036_11270 [Desulfotomaculum defluvii]
MSQIICPILQSRLTSNNIFKVNQPIKENLYPVYISRYLATASLAPAKSTIKLPQNTSELFLHKIN